MAEATNGTGRAVKSLALFVMGLSLLVGGLLAKGDESDMVRCAMMACGTGLVMAANWYDESSEESK